MLLFCFILLALVEISQRAGNNTIGTCTSLYLWKVVFQHLNGLVFIARLTDIGGLVEDVVVGILRRYLDNQLTIILRSTDKLREEWCVLRHL